LKITIERIDASAPTTPSVVLPAGKTLTNKINRAFYPQLFRDTVYTDDFSDGAFIGFPADGGIPHRLKPDGTFVRNYAGAREPARLGPSRVPVPLEASAPAGPEALTAQQIKERWAELIGKVFLLVRRENDGSFKPVDALAGGNVPVEYVMFAPIGGVRIPQAANGVEAPGYIIPRYRYETDVVDIQSINIFETTGHSSRRDSTLYFVEQPDTVDVMFGGGFGLHTVAPDLAGDHLLKLPAPRPFPAAYPTVRKRDIGGLTVGTVLEVVTEVADIMVGRPAPRAVSIVSAPGVLTVASSYTNRIRPDAEGPDQLFIIRTDLRVNITV
jgi:hypothetical protein